MKGGEVGSKPVRERWWAWEARQATAGWQGRQPDAPAAMREGKGLSAGFASRKGIPKDG